MRPADKAEIARRFKALRREADFTQRRLAGVIGICRQTISEIEHQHVMPHCATWRRFAALEEKHMQPRLTLPVRWQ